MSEQHPHVRALVLDATPLITQSYTHYQNYAESFYTAPTVLHEIKDEKSRKNLEIWQGLGTLKVRHPSAASIKRVSDFAKLTGDYSVLSANDIHIIALTYELETELNKGDWRLRKKPGEPLKKEAVEVEEKEKKEKKEKKETAEDAGFTTVEKKKKKTRRGGKKQREKREAARKEEEEKKKAELAAKEEEEEAKKEETKEKEEQEEEDGFFSDDDGDWITPDNLTETIIKDSGEDTTGGEGVVATKDTSASLELPYNQVALATGDFAVQNVSLQLNLNLMNFMSGLRIKRLRNYMLRCHACFQLLPMRKDGKPKHFCPSCGGPGTLLRCAVSVDSTTGKVTPHLKANFQWNNRGNRYSLPSPLSKNATKRFGKKGFVHTKHDQGVELLREDQKEYEKAVKQEEWTRKHNEKILNNWIGGGSAENYISPFAIDGLKHHSVRVGRGRFANSVRKR
ncbi:Nin1 binding protein [Kluyveromyces marxianus]|nr:Nin1 binding protein [Kluyveromyces marxianus]KAG0679286.1 Nin1 binding protein [Kluyveromyces marxianus]